MVGNKLTYKRDDAGLYVCQYCDASYEKQNAMHYHLKKHMGLYPHKCKHCDKQFLQKKQLDLHVEAKHPATLATVTTYACPSCEFNTKQKGNLHIHFMRIHCKDLCCFVDSNKPSTCKKCETKFANSTSFYYHAFTCTPPSSKHQHYSDYLDLIEADISDQLANINMDGN
jgi:hypothetical protein